MEIRNNAEALKAFLGVSSPASAQTKQVQGANSPAAQAALSGDQATVSQIGAEVSQAANDGVRMDKVAAVQQALAAGTFRVSTDAVADRVIDAMMTGGAASGE